MNTKTAPACFDVRKVLTANAMKQRMPRTPRKAYAPKTAMFKHEVTAGVGFDKDGKPLFPQLAIDSIRLRLAVEFGGYSETVVRGGYMHANGEFVNEESRTWTIVTNKPIGQACAFIRAALNQESVLLVTIAPKLVKFIGAGHV